MSACPAYLGLTVVDVGAAASSVERAKGQRSSPTVLLRSDLLIFCPSNFTVRVRLAAPPSAVAAGGDDAAARYSVVVRFTDWTTSPFDVRLTHVEASSESTGRYAAGAARHRPSPTPTIPAEMDAAPVRGLTGVLIAMAITGTLLIAVYVGRNTARATAPLSGTLLVPTNLFALGLRLYRPSHLVQMNWTELGQRTLTSSVHFG